MLMLFEKVEEGLARFGAGHAFHRRLMIPIGQVVFYNYAAKPPFWKRSFLIVQPESVEMLRLSPKANAPVRFDG